MRSILWLPSIGDGMTFVITTVQHAERKELSLTELWADRFKVPFVPRNNQSLAFIRERYQADVLLIATKQGPLVHTAGGDFFFHLSMAELRIKNLLNGKHDHMVAAMGLEPGMEVLDCTLGLSTDAIVASLAVGDGGRVVGLEASPLIALITEYGLKNFKAEDILIKKALERIEVIHADYHSYLEKIPKNSFDVVYFDPMFRQPIQTSSNLKPIRFLADTRPLTREALDLASIAARKKVVVKETRGSSEFQRLGIESIMGGKYSSISYGVIDRDWDEGAN